MLDSCLAKSYVFEVFEVCFEQNESKRQLSLGVKHRSGTHTQKHTSSISTCAEKQKIGHNGQLSCQRVRKC